LNFRIKQGRTSVVVPDRYHRASTRENSHRVQELHAEQRRRSVDIFSFLFFLFGSWPARYLSIYLTGDSPSLTNGASIPLSQLCAFGHAAAAPVLSVPACLTWK